MKLCKGARRALTACVRNDRARLSDANADIQRVFASGTCADRRWVDVAKETVCRHCDSSIGQRCSIDNVNRILDSSLESEERGTL